MGPLWVGAISVEAVSGGAVLVMSYFGGVWVEAVSEWGRFDQLLREMGPPQIETVHRSANTRPSQKSNAPAPAGEPTHWDGMGLGWYWGWKPGAMHTTSLGILSTQMPHGAL